MSKKRCNLDENFWSVPNLINSYWAGFSAADCYIGKKNGKSYRYVLCLQLLDKNHIEQFLKDTKCETKIYVSKVLDKRSLKYRDRASIFIPCSKWIDDLTKNFNIINNKTYRLQPPDLGNELNLAWLIGYTDGDGSIGYDKDKDRIRITYASCSKATIEWVNQIINRNFPWKLRDRKNNIYSSGNCWLYKINGLQAALTVYYLKHFSVPKMSRKWDNLKVLNCIEKRKEEYPEFFNNFDSKDFNSQTTNFTVSNSNNITI